MEAKDESFVSSLEPAAPAPAETTSLEPEPPNVEAPTTAEPASSNEDRVEQEAPASALAPPSPAAAKLKEDVDVSANTSDSHYEDVEMTLTPVKDSAAVQAPTTVGEVKRDLFANIRYYLINSGQEDEVVRLLSEYGAAQDKYLSSFITHVICDRVTLADDETELDSEYVEATEVFELKIVKSDWIFKSIYANALLP